MQMISYSEAFQLFKAAGLIVQDIDLEDHGRELVWKGIRVAFRTQGAFNRHHVEQQIEYLRAHGETIIAEKAQIAAEKVAAEEKKFHTRRAYITKSRAGHYTITLKQSGVSVRRNYLSTKARAQGVRPELDKELDALIAARK